MLRFLSLLGCTKIVQTKCGSVEGIENIESEFGGASRDRTDGLVVANDGSCRCYPADSVNLRHVLCHFQPPVIGPAMGQVLGQTRLRTPTAS